MMIRWLLVSSLLATSANAFAPQRLNTNTRQLATSVEQNAFWRHWIPEPEEDTFVGLESTDLQQQTQTQQTNAEEDAKTVFLGSLLAAVLMVAPQVTMAVSGGGLDYANLDITGQNFSNGNYKGKDFTQVIAKGTNFAKSNLQGCRFYKAYLVSDQFHLVFDVLIVDGFAYSIFFLVCR